MSATASPDANRDRRERRGRLRGTLALALWVFGAIVIAVLAWSTYDLTFDLDNCFLGTAHGGRTSSPGWAGVMGLLLFVAAAVLAFRWRGRWRRLLLLLAAFTAVYAVGLFGLWALTPKIWGPVRCT